MIMLLATAVDPQSPVTIQNPLMEYVLPRVLTKTLYPVILNPPGRGLIQGPVSANPIGIYGSYFHPVFHDGIMQRQWNSFNLGEFFWPDGNWLTP